MKTISISKQALILGTLASCVAAHANYIQNGDFEGPGNTLGKDMVGSNTIPFWNIVGGTNDNVNLAFFEGSNVVDLSGFSDHVGQGLSQTMSNPAGMLQLDFDGGTLGFGNSSIEVLLNGTPIAQHLKANPTSHFTFNFLAPVNSTITFLSQDQGWVNNVDNIVVNQVVPEPSTLAALALGAVVVLRRRRKGSR